MKQLLLIVKIIVGILIIGCSRPETEIEEFKREFSKAVEEGNQANYERQRQYEVEDSLQDLKYADEGTAIKGLLQEGGLVNALLQEGGEYPNHIIDTASENIRAHVRKQPFLIKALIEAGAKFKPLRQSVLGKDTLVYDGKEWVHARDTIIDGKHYIVDPNSF